MGKLVEHRAIIVGENNLFVDCKLIFPDGVETPIGPVVSDEELADLKRKHELARTQNTPDSERDRT